VLRLRTRCYAPVKSTDAHRVLFKFAAARCARMHALLRTKETAGCDSQRRKSSFSFSSIRKPRSGTAQRLGCCGFCELAAAEQVTRGAKDGQRERRREGTRKECKPSGPDAVGAQQ
jgi:hypothetical protein